MHLFRNTLPLLTAALLMTLAVWLVFPFYQYYIDPDAVAYLTLAKRYASGAFPKAVNGYWSPWAVWLTAIFIRFKMAPFAAAILVNTMGGIGFLSIAHSLFLRFKIGRVALWFLNLTLAGFLVYAVFWQSFDDLWECFFLLLVLRLLIHKDFLRRPALWMLAGLFGALAFYAKAYALPFVVLELLVLSFYMRRTVAAQWRWLQAAATAIFCMLLCCLPWCYVLQAKYGFWTTGTAGRLNLSWYLVGHPYWQQGTGALLPPVYADSPSYWEDPFIANGAAPVFWQSPKLFLMQLVRLGYNVLKLFQSLNELSAFFALLIVAAAGILVHPKLKALFEEKLRVVLLAMLLFPLGYLLINFEGRYLWFMAPPALLLGALLLEKLRDAFSIKRGYYLLLWAVFSLSFLVRPALGLKEMYRAGEVEFRQAAALKAAGIQGSFTSNIPSGAETQNILRLAYFSGNPYYTLPRPATKNELLQELRRYGVRYYFHFHPDGWTNFQLPDEQGVPFAEVSGGRVSGILVFEIK